MYKNEHSHPPEGALNLNPAMQLQEGLIVRRYAEILPEAATQEAGQHRLLIGRKRGEERILDLADLSSEL